MPQEAKSFSSEAWENRFVNRIDINSKVNEMSNDSMNSRRGICKAKRTRIGHYARIKSIRHISIYQFLISHLVDNSINHFRRRRGWCIEKSNIFKPLHNSITQTCSPKLPGGYNSMNITIFSLQDIHPFISHPPPLSYLLHPLFKTPTFSFSPIGRIPLLKEMPSTTFHSLILQVREGERIYLWLHACTTSYNYLLR